jgi:hypothetical protein
MIIQVAVPHSGADAGHAMIIQALDHKPEL